MSSLRAKLGKTIRELRSQAGYSQEGFADVVGMHRTYMGSVERGEVNISLDNIERIASALELSAGALLVKADRAGSAGRD